MLSPYGVWFLILGNSRLRAVGLLLFRLSRVVGLFRVILVLVFWVINKNEGVGEGFQPPPIPYLGYRNFR